MKEPSPISWCRDPDCHRFARLRHIARAALAAVLSLVVVPGSAHAEDLGIQASRLPLSKAFDQPFFTLGGSHVEMFSLLFLFLATIVVMSVSRRRQLVRHLIQIISLLVFFYVVFSCLGVFGMIRNTIHGISLIGTVYTEAFFWMSLPVCVVAFTIMTGPFFCGWICPTGTIQELFAMGRELLTRKRELSPSRPTLVLMTASSLAFLYLVFRVSEQRQLFVEDSSLYWAACSLLIPLMVMLGLVRDRPSRGLRWVSLGSILASSVLKVTITSPVHFAFVDIVDPASAITTLVLALASLFIARSWCRYLCPWGLVMSLSHRVSRLRFVVQPNKCSGCGICATACRPGAIENGRIITEHCQFCYACLDACTKNAVTLVDTWSPPPRGTAPPDQARRHQLSSAAE